MRLLTLDPTLVPLPQPWARVAVAVVETAARVAFWLAVFVPVAYLVVLATLGLDPAGLRGLFGVIVVHALVLLVGQSHDPRR